MADGIVTVPPGEVGIWRVEKFTVSDTHSKLEWVASHDGRYTPPGTYTKLMMGGTLVMSDTPDEMRDHSYFIHVAHGRVLLNGLGLGMVLKKLLEKPEIEHVDIVEVSEEVIALVGPTYQDDPRVHVHHGDALTFKFPTGSKWNYVWNDIWDDLCLDNLPEMDRLHRRYGRRAEWIGSWGRGYLELMREREKQYRW